MRWHCVENTTAAATYGMILVVCMFLTSIEPLIKYVLLLIK